MNKALGINLIALLALITCGCATRRSALPGARSGPPTARTKLASTASPDSPEMLPLDRIQPKPVLPPPGGLAATMTTTAPTSRPSLEAIELYARARDAQIRGDRIGAVTQLERAVAADPESFELRFALARAYLASGAKGEKVLDTLLAAERIQPDDVRVQLALGRQYLLKSDTGSALRHLRLAVQTHDYSSDEDQAALTDFYLARVLQQNGYDRAALDAYARLVQRLEHSSSDLRGSAELAYLINRPEGLYGDIGRLYEKHGQLDEALRAYEFVAEHNPNNFEAQSRVVNTLLAMGRRDEAISKSVAAVRSFRANNDSLQLLRSVYKRLGNERGVVDELARLHQENPADRAILFALADTLGTFGQRQRAADLLTAEIDRTRSIAGGGAIDIVKKLYSLHESHDDTAGAAKVLIEYLARRPDAMTELSPLWDALIRGSRKNSLRLADLQKLSVSSDAEACKQFWISRLAQLWNRDMLARTALEQSIKHRPIFPPAYRVEVDQIFQRTEWNDADKAAHANELVDSVRAAGSPALAEELRGRTLLLEKKPDDAVKAFAESMRLGNTSPDLALMYATAIRARGETQRYEQLLWKLVSDRPGYEEAYASLFSHYVAANSGAQARKVLTTWLAADPQSINGRVLQATVLAKLADQPQAAESIYLDLFREHPDEPEVLISLREFYTQQHRLPEWIEKLEAERAKHPGNRVAVEQLVDIYVSLKRPADASRVLDAARTAVADDPDLLYYLAHLYEQVDQKQTTEQILADVLRIDPKHVAANNDLGYTWADAGKNLDEAEQMIRTAVEQEPDNESFLDSLGWVLYKRGRFEEARRYLQQAVGPSTSPDPVVLDHLGDTLYRLSDRPNHTDAAEQWKRALSRATELSNAGVPRTELPELRLSVQQKLRQLEQKQPVTVAPTVEQPKSTAREHAKN